MYWVLTYEKIGETGINIYCQPTKSVQRYVLDLKHYRGQMGNLSAIETQTPPAWYALKRLQGAPHDQWVKKDD